MRAAALDAVAAATRRVTLLALAVAQAPPLPAEDALALDGPGVRAALSALAYDVGTLACAIRHARDPRSPRDDEAVTASCALGADAGAASAIPAIADDAPRVVLARGAAARADSARIGAALDVIVTVDRARAREALRAALVAAGGALAEEQAAFDAALATAARRYRDTLSGGGWAVDLDAAAALATYAADDDDLDAVLAALTRWAEPAADAPAACRGLAPLDCVRSAFAAASPPRAERLDALEDALAVYAAALPRGCAPGDLACARIIGAVDTIGGELGDLQDLALQDALSHADRDLTTLANMMKARRDSAENAVDNLK
ncbi:MAG: hypothetical protein H6745_21845 [Deltaproteobacteria bacterium]|nr:hypothetical protein [Deltaproteobacteria bacterium]